MTDPGERRPVTPAPDDPPQPPGPKPSAKRQARGTEGLDETGNDRVFHAHIMKGAKDTGEIKEYLRALYLRAGITDPWWLDHTTKPEPPAP